jgi:hypothetical protein
LIKPLIDGNNMDEIEIQKLINKGEGHHLEFKREEKTIPILLKRLLLLLIPTAVKY